MTPIISPSLNLNGTLGWTVTDLNATAASLNVTRDLTRSSGEILTPTLHHTGSLNESINLATRIAMILPFIEPEMDQALQMGQTNMATSVPAGFDWSSTASAVNNMMIRQPLHTMWWVNGPLKVNDTIPVLVFPTNVTGSTTVDVGGSIGSRSAWILVFPKTRSLLPPEPVAALTSSIPVADNFGFALTFNYDQKTDLLLSASADIHFGFGAETTIQSTPCNASATIVCPASNSVSILREFGIDIQASLKLASTTLDLSGPLTLIGNSGSSNGSSSGGGTGGGSGSGSGSGSSSGTSTGNSQGSGAGSAPGSNSGSNSGSGSGYSPGSGSTTTGAGQPDNNPAQSKPATQSPGLPPWMYGILGIIAASIVASILWFARRRVKKDPAQVPPARQST